jgi:methyl-accepting chemotaxis protein
MLRLRNAPIIVKLTAVAIIAAIGVLLMSATRLAAIRPAEMDARQTKVRNLVESAQSLAASYHKRVLDKKATTEQAQRDTLAALRDMRYDQKEYFWVNDMRAWMLMHPIKPELDGTDVSTMADPNGKRLFVEFVKTVEADGAGFVNYLWPKPGHPNPVPKISYVSGFAPWNWVIGTGIYIDDVDTIVAEKRRVVVVQTLAVLVGILVVLGFVSAAISRPLRGLTVAMRRLAAGDLDVQLPQTGRDEVGQMGTAVRVLHENLVAKHTLEQENAALQERAEDERRRATAELAEQLQATVSAILERLADAVTSMQDVAADLGRRTGDLVGSVREISGRAGESTAAATRAAREAADVSGTVTGLTSAAETIGGVITVIRAVAAQTNLLALNATIEAARAGELGKGFAVVANEVKELAQQSARATDEIAREVESIQTTSQEAAAVMGRMAETVHTLGEATQGVASTITGADGSGEPGVLQSVEETGEVARRIQRASDDLAAEATRLREDFAELLERMATT